MNIGALLAGALTLRDETFTTLRERSDVFYRGFLVVLLVGLLAGAFQAGFQFLAQVANPPNAQQLTSAAMQRIDASGNLSETQRATVESYVREGVGMFVDISQLPPQAGTAFGPVASFLNWLGQTVSTPFSLGLMGLVLIAGLLVQMTSRWLGGHGSAVPMLGMAALSLAPQLLDPVSSLLTFLGSVTASSVFGLLNTLLGWVILIWGAAIFVKATAITQGFSLGRSLGAILIALALALVVVVVLAFLAAALFAALLVPFLRSLALGAMI